MRLARVEDGVVVNIIESGPVRPEWAADWPEAGAAGLGWRWVDGAFVPPDDEPAPDPVPEQVSRFQAKAALMQAGMLGAVEAALAQADPVARLAWAEAVEFRRNSPTIAALSGALGLTEEQVDNLFCAAAQIEA